MKIVTPLTSMYATDLGLDDIDDKPYKVDKPSQYQTIPIPLVSNVEKSDVIHRPISMVLVWLDP